MNEGGRCVRSIEQYMVRLIMIMDMWKERNQDVEDRMGMGDAVNVPMAWNYCRR